MDRVQSKKNNLTFSDQARVKFKGILDFWGGFFNRIGLMPNTMTILGLVGNIIGAVLLAMGQFLAGGILILMMGPVDVLDGTMARLRGMASSYGAFVDSVSDRYSELIILGGLLYFYLGQDNDLAALLVYAAAAGSVLVSYVRARAQSVGWETKVGILTRFERYLVLAPALIFSFLSPLIPLIAIGIIAVLANVTALQRIIDIRRQFKISQKAES